MASTFRTEVPPFVAGGRNGGKGACGKMVDAINALWHGNNYQARIFWDNALNLLYPSSCVAEVTFEANGPKAFDDVVVKYDPPIPRSQNQRVAADYHQVKWHTEYGGRFGYEDLTRPEFIGAQSVSLLQRLKQARKSAEASASFSFISTYGIRDDDPLKDLIAGTDKSLLVEKLFDGTKTDSSRMGKVRKAWREHLGLTSDDALKGVVTGLRIFERHRSLDELRHQINQKAVAVGLQPCATNSDFRYDELARQLKVRNLHSLTKETLLRLCEEEGLLVSSDKPADQYLPVAIRSFLGTAAEHDGTKPENTLLLTDHFRQRYLKDDISWQNSIRPLVIGFLSQIAKQSSKLKLVLDAHASVAFLAGSVLGVKSGLDVSLIQKGRVGTRIWRADDMSEGPLFEVIKTELGMGDDIAVAISVAQPVDAQTKAYVDQQVPSVGTLISFALTSGPGQSVVAGGAHAAALAEQISNAIRTQRGANPDSIVHIFAAVPNSLTFFLGQQHQGIAPCVVYEFDFDRQGSKTYQPSVMFE